MFLPPEDDPPATRLADWLEIQALVAEYGQAPVELLWESLGIANDEALLDTTLEEEARESLLGKAASEVDQRLESLGQAYPFKLSNGGAYLKFATDLTPGALTYLLCLRLSLPSSPILVPRFLPEISPNERTLFQYCANLAAAGYLGGRAYAFGWPRPDRSGLLEALRTVEEAMHGEGEVHTDPPCAPKQAKDDEVDVIAWLPHKDSPGWALTMWGQVASGANWKDKPLGTDKVDQFRRRWYRRPPVLTPIRAMFVPFCLLEEERNLGGISYKEALLDMTQMYGIIFHRHRLPACVQKAYNREGEVEGVGGLSKGLVQTQLQDWWKGFREALRHAALSA